MSTQPTSTPAFSFKELDPEGHETLEAVANAGRFNRYMYQAIKPHLTGRVLEIGSGIGNISHFASQQPGVQLHLSDVRQAYLGILNERFPAIRQQGHIHKLDLQHPQFEEEYAPLLGTYDAVFALNVVEHLKDDTAALRNMKALLKPGGHAIVLVPAFQSLYNPIDKALEHYRRYTRASLLKVFHAAQLTPTHKRYFNALGIPAWFISGKLQGNNVIPKGQMKAYDYLVPLVKLLDVFCRPLLGLSVIVVGQKPVAQKP